MDKARSERIGYLALIFWVGFAALIYQIYSVNVLFLFFVQNTHAVALAVSSFLAGLAFSSLFFSRLTHHNTRSRRLVCGMACAAGLYGYLVLTHYEWIPLMTDAVRRSLIATPVIATALKYTIMWVYLFFPAFFLGGAFPLVNGLYLSSRDEAARDTGTVYFWDTLGAIAGSLVAGFILLPYVGLKGTAMVAAGINLLIAIQLLRSRRLALLALLCFALVMSYEVYRQADDPISRFRMSDGGHILPGNEQQMDQRFGDVLFQQESPYGRITVGQMGTSKILFVNYRSMCTDEGSSELGIAQNIMRGSKAGAQVLNIGLGCGRTGSILAEHAHTKQIDIVEINPVMPKAASYFKPENHDVLHRKNVQLHIADGAEWLRTNPKRYDRILIDVEEVSVIYSSPLYTKEYFTYARDRLKPNGVFAVWSFSVSPEFSRVMYNTLKAVFPYVQIDLVDGNFIHAYAARQPLDLPPQIGAVQAFTDTFLQLDLDDINTLDNRALERHYSSNRLFTLPAYYEEKFVR